MRTDRMLTMHGWTVYLDGRVIGWIRNRGCEHTKCLRRMREGAPFHAIPAAPGQLLDDYHFATLEAAQDALEATYDGG